MNLKTTIADPLKILSSTKYVVENAQKVELNLGKIKEIIDPIKKRIEKGLDEATSSAGFLGDFNKDCQLMLIEHSVNFCFWAEKDKPKWQVEYPKGNIINGGWFGLEACFKRAIENNIPVLSADYLSNIDFENVKKLFESSNTTIIPLIEERGKNLIEIGKLLLKKYNGEFVNLLEESSFDAINIAKNVYQNFSSFKDFSKFDGRKVYFFKRAQILANDIGLVCKNYGKKGVKNLEKLTAFADYKLPQMLRMFNVMIYSKELASKVDNYVLIPKDSKEEIEIRATTIWAVELLRQMIPKFTAGQIDNALWLLSQDQSKLEKPYHRTYSIFY